MASSHMAQVGPYPPSAGEEGSTAIHKDSSVFVGWAQACVLERGWQNINDKSLGKTSVGDSLSCLQKPGVNGVVSLGDGGSATVTFEYPIKDGPGVDFAVFENAFNATFLELAFVEVSSDGSQFFRFDASSLTDTITQKDNNASLDASYIHNLAGKYKANYGTPFDLNELAETPGLDIDKVSHVRIVDVVGSLNATYASMDADGRKINDPWPTAFPSGGFDLDAVGVIHASTVSAANERNASMKAWRAYPNPVQRKLHVDLEEGTFYFYSILDVNGMEIIKGHTDGNLILNMEELEGGIYFFRVIGKEAAVTKK